MSTTTRQHIQLAGPWLLLVSLSAGLSLVAALWPLPVVAGIGLLVLIVITVHMLSGLRFWQKLTAIGLLGYAVLGYGFSNLTFPRIPLPVGHMLMFGGLLLALPGRGPDVRKFLREPVAWCWLGLSSLTLLHLIRDIPRYGLFAIRDSSFIIEIVFLLSGFLWARLSFGLSSMVRTLMLIFLLNLVHSLTYPFEEFITAVSPQSGIFQDIPLFGTYWNATIFLLCGALFVFLVGRHVLKGWPPIVVGGFAFLQLAWSLIFQARTTYLSMLAAAAILVLTGERRRVATATMAIAMSIVLIGLVGILGVELEGRLGRLTPEFILQHVRSLFLRADTPGVETVEWRVDLMPYVMERWTSSTSTVLIGEGFGQALIEWDVQGGREGVSATCTEAGASGCGVQVRQPHNTHVTALMRLGLVGLLVWAAMHIRIVYLLIRGARATSASMLEHAVVVWALTFYAAGMILTTFQPYTEFSHGAIPFYALIGFAIGLEYRWRPNGISTQSGRRVGEALQSASRRHGP